MQIALKQNCSRLFWLIAILTKSWVLRKLLSMHFSVQETSHQEKFPIRFLDLGTGTQMFRNIHLPDQLPILAHWLSGLHLKHYTVRIFINSQPASIFDCSSQCNHLYFWEIIICQFIACKILRNWMLIYLRFFLNLFPGCQIYQWKSWIWFHLTYSFRNQLLWIYILHNFGVIR